MKEILLTQDQITLVDDEDFEWLSQWTWRAYWFSSAESFYAGRKENGKDIYMSREIMDCPEGKLVDHKSHNTLNNQKYNLRVCTRQQNRQNSRGNSNATSKYKGVFWRKNRGIWRASISLRDIFDRRFNLNLGQFEIEEEAALAYDNAAIKHFGEFAYLNFPRQK